MSTNAVPERLVDDFTRINRAYNLMYALGAEQGTVELTLSECDSLIQTAHEVAMGVRTTEFHRQIADNVNPTMLRYVAVGFFGRAQ